MATTATWKPHTKHATFTSKAQNELPETAFAFPKQRKEPLTDAAHVRNAIARFDQVKDVSDEDRAVAFANICKAAKHWHIDVEATSWEQLGREPHQGYTSRR
jgi:hypothetical protein